MFLPTILKGQLCNKLTLNMTSGQGKRNELMLLLDYNEERLLHLQGSSTIEKVNRRSKEILNFDTAVESVQGKSAKVHINTLSSYVGFGGGIYIMTDVKRMSATDDFLKMQLKDRKCEVELYEDCRTRKLLEECKCVPWEFPGYQVLPVLKTSKHTKIGLVVLQDLSKCSPKGRDCTERNSGQTFNCKTTCEGIYAGVEWKDEILSSEGDTGPGIKNKAMTELYKEMYERMKEDLQKEMRLMKGNNVQKGEELDKKKYLRLVSEYKNFNKSSCQHFRFNSAPNLTQFSKFQILLHFRVLNMI